MPVAGPQPRRMEIGQAMIATSLAAVLALGLPFPAVAGMGVEVEVLDRKAGDVLPVYWQAGE